MLNLMIICYIITILNQLNLFIFNFTIFYFSHKYLYVIFLFIFLSNYILLDSKFNLVLLNFCIQIECLIKFYFFLNYLKIHQMIFKFINFLK